MTAITFADLFAGCGGLSQSFHGSRLFNQFLATDYWKAAEESYLRNHRGAKFELLNLEQKKEVETLTNILSGNVDLILGGPPCTGFSTLGKRQVGCAKSMLVDVFIQICMDVSPKVILMENVKTIRSKSHPKGGKVLDHVNKTLTRAGYEYRELTLKATDFGLGQTRERFFLLAVKKKNSSPTFLNETVNSVLSQKKSKHNTLYDLIGDLPKIEAGEGAEIMKHRRKYLYNHRAMNHSEKLIARLKHVPPGGGLMDVPRHLLTDHLRRMVSDKYGSGGHQKNIYGRMDWGKPSGTIVAGMDKITVGRFVHPDANRLLTPRECARIQGFKDNFIFSGSLVTQYYLIGNAVPRVFSEVWMKSLRKNWGLL